MNSMNDFGDSIRAPEFQAVFIIDYDDGRMFPLTEDTPKCLLPVGNRRLLSYQLDMLAKSGVAEVYIVAPKEYEVKLSHFLGEYVRASMSIDLVVVEEMSGSADGLRAVSDRIRGDFFCLGSDFVSQYCIGELANMHRLCSSDLTMMLTVASSDVKKDEVDEEFIGICDDGRIMIKLPTLEIDEMIEITKPLLHHAPTLSLRKDIVDMGVYLMSHWVMEFLATNTRISSIRTDLVPYLINRQFQPTERLLELMPALEHRNRPLKAIEPWIMDITPGGSVSRAVQADMAHSGYDEDRGQAILDLLSAASDHNQSGALHRDSPVPTGFSSPGGMNTPGGKNALPANAVAAAGLERTTDMLRCFGLLYEPPARTELAAAAGNISILSRVVNIPSYLTLNKDMILHKNSHRTPWARIQGILKKELSIIGEGCNDVANEKTITMKQCCIGANCTIGTGAKLNNCVIMDNVTIGDNCTVQNSIICDRVVIESNCKLNDCNIGSGYRIVTGSKIKSESFSSASH